MWLGCYRICSGVTNTNRFGELQAMTFDGMKLSMRIHIVEIFQAIFFFVF